MERNHAKRSLVFAAVLYAAAFVFFNWSDISWVFNYKEISGLVSDFFNPYPSIDASTIDDAYFYPNHSSELKAAPVISPQTVYTEKQNTIEIPKISISAPIVFPESNDRYSLTKDLDRGVVYYPGSVYPGQSGQIVILGHSAPAGWPKIKHDWVFTDLDKLEPGDTILIDLNNKQYTYIVRQKKIIARGTDVSQGITAENGNVLTLISCWPPGKDYQRITVEAALLTK